MSKKKISKTKPITDLKVATRKYLDKRVSFRDASGTLLIGWCREVKLVKGKPTLFVRDVNGRATLTYQLEPIILEVFIIGG